MLCYVMLCYVMLCYVMLCYVMLFLSSVISSQLDPITFVLLLLLSCSIRLLQALVNTRDVPHDSVRASV